MQTFPNYSMFGAAHLTLEGEGGVILKEKTYKDLLEEKNCVQHK